MTKHVKLLKIYLVLVGLAGFLHTINFVTCNKLAARDNELVHGCIHNGSIFAEKSMIPTMESCLLCKCQSKNLVCVRRVCPEQPIPPPRGCILVQKKSMCCPYLSCSKMHVTFYKNDDRKVIKFGADMNQIDDFVPTNEVAGKHRRSDDEDEESGACFQDGTVYKAGSAMSSSSLCSYCFCIAGKQKCVKPRCMLAKTNCEPIYVDSSCCPIRYDCHKKFNLANATLVVQRTNNKHYLRNNKRNRSNGCFVDSNYYTEGQKLPFKKNRPCDVCFCIKGMEKCTPKQCAPPIKNCIPKVPQGECCAISYDCRHLDKIKSRELQPPDDDSFDFLSLLFGPDDPLEENSESPKEISTTASPEQIPTTSEKGFFDLLRAGLELIDAHEDKIDSVISPPTELDNNKFTTESKENNNENILTSIQQQSTTLKTTTVGVQTTKVQRILPSSISLMSSTHNPEAKVTTKPTISKLETTSTAQASTKITSRPTTLPPRTTKVVSTKKVVTTTKPTTLISTKVPQKSIKTTKMPQTLSQKPENSTRTYQKPKVSTTKSSQIVNVTTLNSTLLKKNTISSKAPTESSTSSVKLETTTVFPETVTNLSTENILSAFFSGLSSIFVDKKNKTMENSSLEYVPTLTPRPLATHIIQNKPKPPVLESDYAYDYNEATLPPSLPNLKIIPFLPADAVNKVNYNLPSITEKYNIYGALDSASYDNRRADYDSGSYNNPYILYGTSSKESQKPDLPVLLSTESNGNSNFDKVKTVHSSVRFNTKFIRDKYDEINPHEKIDKFESDIKYIPNKYETNYNDYMKYTGDVASSNEKYYSYDNSGLFSPPTKTEGGFIPRDTVKDEYFYKTYTTNLKMEHTTSEPQHNDETIDKEHPSFENGSEFSSSKIPETSSQSFIQNSSDILDPELVKNPQKFNNQKYSLNSTRSKVVLETNSQTEDPNDRNLGSVFDFLFTPEDDELDSTIPTFKNISDSLPSMKDLIVQTTIQEVQNTTTPFTTLKPSTKLATKGHSTTKNVIKKTSTTTLKPPETTAHRVAAPMSNYAINPIDFDKMRHHHSEGEMEIFSKPTLASMNGLLKLAGCNIYGRMYRVGKIITELSTECLECKCTEIGVSCVALPC